MHNTVDCRDLEFSRDCSVSFAADSMEELMEAVLAHATGVHLQVDSPQLRAQIRERIGEQNQPAL